MSRRLAPAEGSARPYWHAPKPRSRAPATRLRVSSPARMRSTSTSGEASVDVARQMPMEHGHCKRSWRQLSLTTTWSRRAAVEARGLKRRPMIEEENIRMAIDRHWAASAAGDQVAEHEIYYDDAVCEYPQSGEIIHGRRNLQALRSHHPGRPSGFEVRRIVGEGNLWVTEYVITYEGKRAYTVSIMEFRDGKVSRET